MMKIDLNGKGFSLISKIDLAVVSKHKWYLAKHGYALTSLKISTNKYKTIGLHRYVMNPPEGMDVDHINGDRLDNRRENLRVCTRSQNLRNNRKGYGRTSKFKGVSLIKSSKKWESRIFLGTFDTEKEAAKKYDKIAKIIYGKYARLNFD